MPPASKRGELQHGVWVVGVTGGIGSGKSTVAAAFSRLGGQLLDADAIAREVTSEPAVLDEIAQLLGPDVVTANSGQSPPELDRARVAERVFGDDRLRESLEQIVHPRVRTKIDKELAKWQATGSDGGSPLPGSRPFLILDIPLLERSPYMHQVSAVVFVDAPTADRVERVKRTRGWSEAELHRRETCQVSTEEKRNGADHVISNPGAGVSEGSAARNADGLEEQCKALIDLWAKQILRS